MANLRFDPTELRRTILDEKLRSKIRDRIIEKTMNPAVSEAKAIADDMTPDLEGRLAMIFALGQMQSAIESAIHWQIGEAAQTGIPLNAISEALGYRGSSSALRHRFPQINEVSEVRERIQATEKGESVKIGDWKIEMEPME